MPIGKFNFAHVRQQCLCCTCFYIPDLNRAGIAELFGPVGQTQEGREVGWIEFDIVLNHDHPVVALFLQDVSTSADELRADSEITGPQNDRGEGDF